MLHDRVEEFLSSYPSSSSSGSQKALVNNHHMTWELSSSIYLHLKSNIKSVLKILCTESVTDHKAKNIILTLACWADVDVAEIWQKSLSEMTLEQTGSGGLWWRLSSLYVHSVCTLIRFSLHAIFNRNRSQMFIQLNWNSSDLASLEKYSELNISKKLTH